MSLWEVLLLGLILGIRHAFDPDHLVAVTTIVSEYKNPLRAIWIGVSWGLGHTTTLLLVGGTLLLFRVRVPEQYSLFFEFLVGVMLTALGIQTFWNFRRRKVHVHPHHHGQDEPSEHRHFHFHEESAGHVHHQGRRLQSWGKLLIAGIKPGEHALENARKAAKPFFRLKSYVVGTVHGLAGSAALMLLALASINSAWHGITYMALFGLGTILSMSAISIVISLPFSASGRIPKANRIIQATAGAVSIAFGMMLMYEIAVVQHLFVAA